MDGMGESAPLIPALEKGTNGTSGFCLFWHISDYMLYEELASLKLGDLHC